MTNSTTPQATTHTTNPSNVFDVELAQLTRNNFVEARHRGRLILLNPDGDVQLATCAPPLSRCKPSDL